MKTSQRLLAAVAAFGVLLGAASTGWAQDWPQWRGEHRDGTVSGFTAPKSWPKELNQKWKVAVGGGDATPALVGDRLYVFTREGSDEVLRCLDATSGKQIWQDRYASEPATPPAGGPHAGPRSSPTVADGKVIALGVRGTLSCTDAATGKNLWRRNDIPGWPQFFTSSSPLVVNGLCIAQLGGTENGAVVAYDLNNGEEKWKWAGGCPGYASPVLITIDGTPYVIVQTQSKIAALTVAGGKLAWEAPFQPQRMNYNASTPIVDGQILIYGGGGRGEQALKFEKQGEGLAKKELWKNPQNSVQFDSPVLEDGVIYGLSQDNKFFALNAKTGRTDWTAPAGGSGGGRRGRGFGSIVAAAPVLFALTPGADLVVFEPSAKGLTELARYKVANSVTYGYPIVSGKRIIIKDEDSVILWTID